MSAVDKCFSLERENDRLRAELAYIRTKVTQFECQFIRSFPVENDAEARSYMERKAADMIAYKLLHDGFVETHSTKVDTHDIYPPGSEILYFRVRLLRPDGLGK